MQKKLIITLSMVLAFLGGLTILPSSPAYAEDGYCFDVAIKSKANGKYISAELNFGGTDYGMLRARASTIGPWEKFRLCQKTATIVGGMYFESTLKSLANGYYVGVDQNLGYDREGMLRAGWATQVGDWERLRIPAGNDPAYIQEVWPNYFASAELGYGGRWTGMIRARAAQVGPWEEYKVIEV